MRNQLSRRLHQFVAPASAGACFVGASMKSSPVPFSINPINAAYIAGIVDGEGTITLTRKHRNEHRQLALTISSTERCLLEFVKTTLGVGKITNKRSSKSNHAPSFTYSVYNRQALILLEHISPSFAHVQKTAGQADTFQLPGCNSTKRQVHPNSA